MDKTETIVQLKKLLASKKAADLLKALKKLQRNYFPEFGNTVVDIFEERYKRNISWEVQVEAIKIIGKQHLVKALPPDFVIAYPKKYKSYNFSRQECKKQGFSRIGGRACYFTRLFARLPKQQKQPLIIKHLQTYFEKVTKSGKNCLQVKKRQIC